MRMLHNWRAVLKRAWSIRLMLLAGLFSSAEILLPMFAGDLPRGVFAVLTVLSVTGAIVARVAVQKGLDDEA